VLLLLLLLLLLCFFVVVLVGVVPTLASVNSSFVEDHVCGFALLQTQALRPCENCCAAACCK